MEFLAFVAFVGLVINSVLARSLIWLFLWFDGFFRPTLSSDPSHLTLSHLISLRHYYLIFHSGIPTNNHKGKGEQPCRTFSSLTRNISSYLSSSCLASHSNSNRGSTTSRRTDSTRAAYHLEYLAGTRPKLWLCTLYYSYTSVGIQLTKLPRQAFNCLLLKMKWGKLTFSFPSKCPSPFPTQLVTNTSSPQLQGLSNLSLITSLITNNLHIN